LRVFDMDDGCVSVLRGGLLNQLGFPASRSFDSDHLPPAVSGKGELMSRFVRSRLAGDNFPAPLFPARYSSTVPSIRA
jgi:hypothetical protein